ncbi:unnamed protein product [Rotaria sordida]|uniref:Protein UNC80 C-terminal domain-containing protein n=1 Tax=Rotaria sordida TaxID=392033 RepID=A0A819PH13_9BILA|nr:unnamed protein product [Rotaria sordida]CAF4014966.1 unnamed protein product [Rotaria sordida]
MLSKTQYDKNKKKFYFKNNFSFRSFQFVLFGESIQTDIDNITKDTHKPIDGLTYADLILLWQIIPYLYGLFLKDLKQILHKEQAEMIILIAGDIPSRKKGSYT